MLRSVNNSLSHLSKSLSCQASFFSDPFTCCWSLSDFPMHGEACQRSNNSLGWSAQLSCSLQHVLWLLEWRGEQGAIHRRFSYCWTVQVRTLCSRPGSNIQYHLFALIFMINRRLIVWGIYLHKMSIPIETMQILFTQNPSCTWALTFSALIGCI